MTTPPSFDAAFRDQLDQLFHWRRDVRHFRPTPVPEAEMQAILRAAALAPSVGNSQPWRFVRLRSPALRTTLAEHVDATSGEAAAAMTDTTRRDAYARLKLHGLREAPEILLVFSDEDPEAGHRLGRVTMPETLRYSTVMAIHTLWLAARARGIGMGWVSILDPAHVTRLVDVPDRWALIALLCLGYPDLPSADPELERRGWQAREPIAGHIIDR